MLNLSNFNTKNVGDADWMFNGLNPSCKIIYNDKNIGKIWTMKISRIF